MDPTEALRQLLWNGAEIERLEDRGSAGDLERVAELGLKNAELLQGLHMWITNGGFLPDQWRPCTECGAEHGTREGRCVRHGKLMMATRPSGRPA